MSYTMYTPLNVWLDPASVTDVVAYIQNYLSENMIYSEEEIEELIHDYLIAHPELIGGVQSVNGKTGTVVLSASDIKTANNVTIESVLSSLSSQISSIAASVATNITSLTGRVTTAETQIDSEVTVRANADTALSNRINALQGAVGSPLKADAVASMTDTSKIYVYTGSETGYTNGNWYYYNGSAWVSGGVYNAVAINTDSTLTVAGMAADAKATGDGLNDLKSSLEIAGVVEEVTYETLAGVIRTSDGTVLGDLPNSHSSGIELKTGDKIVVTAFTYAQFSILAEVLGENTYGSLIGATTNGMKTTEYTATRDMVVSFSFMSNKDNSAVIYRQFVTSSELGNTLFGSTGVLPEDVNNYLNSDNILNGSSDRGVYITVDPKTGLINATGTSSGGTVLVSKPVTLSAGEYRLFISFSTATTVPNTFGLATSRTNPVIQFAKETDRYNYEGSLTIESDTVVYLFIHNGSAYYETDLKVWMGPSNLFSEYYFGCDISKTYTKRIWREINKINVINGKTINFLGDSLTYGSGANEPFTTVLSNEYGCITRNYGVYGSTIQYSTHDPMCERYTAMSDDADIVACMGGTNDYWLNLALGAMGDTTNNTLYGALDIIVSGLVRKYPHSFVYMVTPPHGYISGDYTEETKSNIGSMSDVVEAIKKVSAKYSVPVLDLFNTGGLYPKIAEQKTLYYSDGVHLNTNGQIKLARLHGAFISANYPR